MMISFVVAASLDGVTESHAGLISRNQTINRCRRNVGISKIKVLRFPLQSDSKQWQQESEQN